LDKKPYKKFIDIFPKNVYNVEAINFCGKVTKKLKGG